MTRLALCVLLLVTAAALTAPAAFATDYCVAPNSSCGGTNVSTLEAALDAADNAPDPDRIFLGAATYTAPTPSGFAYIPGLAAPVEIIGHGVGETVLTSPIGGFNSVLRILGSGSSIHDLTVRLPQYAAAGSTGIETIDTLVKRVAVVEAASQLNQRVGIWLHGGVVEDSTVDMSVNQETTAVGATHGGEDIRRSTLKAQAGVASAHGVTLERSRLHAAGTGVYVNGPTTITDSLIRLTNPKAVGVYANTQTGQDTTVNADGITVIGSGGAETIGVFANTSNDDAQDVTVNMIDSVLRGFGATLETFATGAGRADINASYSAYNPSGNIHVGTGAITASNVTNLGDAGFVNAAGGDYRLRFDSPLVDIGEPGAPTTTLDLAGGVRLAGGRRDIGAYEYQARQPLAAIAGPATARAGERVTFSAAGSSDPDPGDALSYAWTLDGAPAGNGLALDASFPTGGPHSVGLTVTDPTGRKTSAGHTVTVSVPVASPPMAAPAGGTDTTAPVLSGLLARPARVRSGRRIGFRFELDEAAAVRVQIQRARAGRRERGACRRPSRDNRGRRRCTRYVHVATMHAARAAGANQVRFSGRVRGRTLPAGRYRAVVRGTDAAGNRSLARRVSFTVTRA